MEKLTERLQIRLSKKTKTVLENSAWLRKMTMAEYLRWLIRRNNKNKGGDNG